MDDDWDILFDSDILSDCYPRFNPNKDVNGKSVIRSIPSSPSKGANFVLINSKCIKEIKESFYHILCTVTIIIIELLIRIG